MKRRVNDGRCRRHGPQGWQRCILLGIILVVAGAGEVFGCGASNVKPYVGRTRTEVEEGYPKTITVAKGTAKYYVRVEWGAGQHGPEEDNDFDVEVWERDAPDFRIAHKYDIEDESPLIEVLTVTDTRALEVGAHTIYARVRRQGTSWTESFPVYDCTVCVTEVASIYSMGVTSETATPGPDETLILGKRAAGMTINILATPNPSPWGWPDGCPIWTNATPVEGYPGIATFPVDVVSPTPSGTVVTATCGTSSKAMRIIVYAVDSVEPSGTTRVMLSTLQDDVYPSPYQTEDCQIKIVATVTPAIQDVTVYFRSQNPDPEDGSPYDPAIPPGGDDNTGAPKLGALMYAQVDTDGSGQAENVFYIADPEYGGAGDNYRIQVGQWLGQWHPLRLSYKQTGLLVAWKRIYVEEDMMFRIGTDLSSSFWFPAGAPDMLEVEDSSIFSVGDWVFVFDTDSYEGTSIVQVGPTPGFISVDDLTDDYHCSRGAAVGKLADGFFNADVQGRTGNAYGVATDGSDGGCFAEVQHLPDGRLFVPYRETLATYGEMKAFRDLWFKNKAKAGENYIWICGAKYMEERGDTHVGATNRTDNFSYIFVAEIEHQYPVGHAIANPDTVVHEIGHQFGIGIVDSDENHPAMWCHEGPSTDMCLMDIFADPIDVYSEFCWDDPNHLMQIRDEPDGI